MEFYPTIDSVFNKFPAATFVPVFIFTILTEALIITRFSGSYPWKNCGTSALVGIGHIITQTAAQGILIGVIAQGVYDNRIFTIPASFENWHSLIPLFFLTELAFYCEHLCAHKIRFLWASHSVHHSTECMNVAAAFRLAWTPVLSGIVFFYLPIIWIGYEPKVVFGMVSASLAYQFFLHTELVKRIGWIEWVVNTPSAHRVHHASNPEYLDKNFGGVLMIWDHVFKTYQPELADVKIEYGLTAPRRKPSNPINIAYGEFVALFRDVWRQSNFQGRLKMIFGPPA